MPSSRRCSRASAEAAKVTTSASTAFSRRCGRQPARSRSPSWPCVTGTRASSASTSPAPRPEYPPTVHLDAFHYVQQANFHITIHAGEAFGLPSIWEALQYLRGRSARPRGADRRRHEGEARRDSRARPAGELRPRPPDPARDVPDLQCPDRRGALHRRAPHRALAAAPIPRDGQHRQPAHERGQPLLGDARLAETFGYRLGRLGWLTINAMKSAFAHFDERLHIINGVIKPGFARAGSTPLPEPAATPSAQRLLFRGGGVRSTFYTWRCNRSDGDSSSVPCRRSIAVSDAGLRQLLHGLPGVDQVGAEARAASLATRSIKNDAKLWAIDMAIRMVDLTTLEGADTPGKVRAMCAKARRPDPTDLRALRGGGLRLPRSRRGRRFGSGGSAVVACQRGDGVPVRAGVARREARRHPRRRRGGRGRGRHGHRPGSVSVGALRAGLRGGAPRPGGLRRGAPESHPRDGRARHATTTSRGRPGSPCSAAPTSSRPRRAR